MKTRRNETEKSVSVRRIGKLLLLIVAVVGIAGAVSVFLRISAHGRELDETIRAQIEKGGPPWSEAVRSWSFLEEARRFAWPEPVEGNAAAVLFPDGVASTSLRCPIFYPQKFDAPNWASKREQWLAAASCGDLEKFRLAGRMAQFDMRVPEVRKGVTPEELMFIADARGPLSGIGALLSNSRRLIEEGAHEQAAQELRSVIGLGVLLVQDAPDIQLMQYGHLAIEAGLSFLAEARGPTASPEELLGITAFSESLPDREGCVGLMKTEMPFTASLPVGIPPVAAVANSEDLPLAIRVNALSGVILGYLGNPKEFFLGPDPGREAAANEIGRSPPLELWWEDMRNVRPPFAWRMRMLQGFLAWR